MSTRIFASCLLCLFSLACHKKKGCCTKEATSPNASSLSNKDFLETFVKTSRYQEGHPKGFKILKEGTALFLRSNGHNNEQALYAIKDGVERLIADKNTLTSFAPTTQTLSKEELAILERLRSTSRGITQYAVSANETHVLIPNSGKLFLLSLQNNTVTKLIDEGGYANSASFSPTGKRIATVREGDLYIIDIASNTQKRLTQKQGPHVEYGLAEFIAQEEMDRLYGYTWLGDGETDLGIAYQENDTSQVEQITITDPSDPTAPPTLMPYPRPGKKNVAVKLWIQTFDAAKPVLFPWNPSEFEYLVRFTYEPKWSTLLVSLQTRDQKKLSVYEFGKEKEAKHLYTETDDAWINIDQSSPFVLDENKYLASTESKGSWSLQMRERNGAVLGNHFQGAYRRIIGECEGQILVAASKDPRAEAIHLLSNDGTATHQLTQDETMATATCNGNHLVVTTKQTNTPQSVSLFGLEGNKLQHRSDIKSHAQLAPLNIEPKLITLPGSKASENEPTHAAILFPEHFHSNAAPKGSLPVLLSIYAGPGVRQVTFDRDRRFMMAQWYANQGFAVVLIDVPGTPHQSRSWERATQYDFVSKPMLAQIKALKTIVAEYPCLEQNRAAIMGWSFGGTMSAYAAINHADFFKAAIAGAPVTDWTNYDTHYTERYLGTPEDHPKAYSQTSPLLAATSNAPMGNLLLAHGTADDNVMFSHSLRLSDIIARRPQEQRAFQFVFLPLLGQTHMVTDPALFVSFHTQAVQFLKAQMKR